MKRNTVAVVTSVSTMMLGAGWAAGVVGAAAHANTGGASINALGSSAVGSTLAPTASATPGSPTPSPSAGAPASASSAPATSSAAGAAAPAAAAPGAAAPAAAAPEAAAPAAAAPAPAAPAPAAPAPAAPAPAPPAPAAPSGTFTGDAASTRYGSYQASITVTAGKITNISMLQTGGSDGTSQQISGYALPLLISAVLQQQTANVGYVSGASYTTQGFQATVQSAMAQAGL